MDKPSFLWRHKADFWDTLYSYIKTIRSTTLSDQRLPRSSASDRPTDGHHATFIKGLHNLYLGLINKGYEIKGMVVLRKSKIILLFKNFDETKCFPTLELFILTKLRFIDPKRFKFLNTGHDERQKLIFQFGFETF